MQASTLCPSDQELSDLNQGRIGLARLEAIETHLDDCPHCQNRMADLDGRTVSIVSALRHKHVDSGETAGKAVPVAAEVVAPVAFLPPRVQVTGGSRNEDVRVLLKRRLLVLSLATVFGSACLLGMSASAAADAVTSVVAQGLGTVVLLICGFGSIFCAGYLWKRPDAKLSRLRLVELFLVVSVSIFGVLFRVSSLSAIPAMTFSSEAHQTLFAEQATLVANLGWYLIIVGYGLFVPNSGRRCLAVVSGIAFASMASLIWVGMQVEPVRPHLPVLVGNTFMGLSLTGAMAVFGSFRINTLQREAAAARRLGQYRLLRQIGSGGMGEVHLAEHALLKRPCAIKLIRPERASDPRLLQRFEREVQATARLSHKNTVEVYDYGRAEDGTFYYVMEYLSGPSLAELIETHGPIPAARAIHFLRQLCGALHEAHGSGLVHRDIKPSNAIVCEQGGQPDVIKLLDFGLVRTPAEDGPGRTDLTQDGVLIGTPDFMAPEQALGTKVDARTDLYSLGALAYYLLSGRPPFRCASVLDTLHAHARTPAPALTEVARSVPGDLALLVMRCLEKSPADRYASAPSLEAALTELAGRYPWTDEDAAAWWSSRSSGNSAGTPSVAPSLDERPTMAASQTEALAAGTTLPSETTMINLAPEAETQEADL